LFIRAFSARIEQEVENERMFAKLGFLVFATVAVAAVGDPWWVQQMEAAGLGAGSESVVVPATEPIPGQVAQQANQATIRATYLGDWSATAFLLRQQR
jgi:hypothetical protein